MADSNASGSAAECCPGEHLTSLAELRDEGIAGGDAPLAACCERELEEKKEANRVLGILREHDPIRRHERERGRAVAMTAMAMATTTAQAPLEDLTLEDDDDDDDDDDDFFLKKFREERLRELQQNASRKAQTLKGRVRTVDNAGLQEILTTHADSQVGKGGSSKGGRRRKPPLLVCQFSVKGDAFSHELSEVVDEIAAAGDFRDTSFVRVEKVKGVVVNHRDKGEFARPPLRHASSVMFPSCPLTLYSLSLLTLTPLSLSLSVNQAALCCFEWGRHKAVLFGEEIGAPEEVSERVIWQWLRSCGCATDKDATRGGGGGGNEDEDEDEVPCEICGRCYPHEHISSVGALRSDSDEYSDDGEGGDGWD